MKFSHTANDLKPLEEKWGVRPPDVDCPKCWPDDGYGYRPTRRGRARFKNFSRNITKHDVKGKCFTCAGTGLQAIPFTEVIKADGVWGKPDVDKWLKRGTDE